MHATLLNLETRSISRTSWMLWAPPLSSLVGRQLNNTTSRWTAVRHATTNANKAAEEMVPLQQLEFHKGKHIGSPIITLHTRLKFEAYTAGIRHQPLRTRLILLKKHLLNRDHQKAHDLCVDTETSLREISHKHEFYKRAIKMFCKIGYYEGAIKVLNVLIDKGKFRVPIPLFMPLLYGVSRHDIRHIQQVVDLITDQWGPTEAIRDDAIFLTVMTGLAMFSPPDVLEQIFRARCAQRPYWIPDIKEEALGLVIARYGRRHDVETAKRLLIEYKLSAPHEPKDVDSTMGGVLLSVLNKEDVTLPQYRSNEDVRSHLLTRSWPPIPHAPYNGLMSIRERSSECFPYTALMMAFRDSKESQLDNIKWLLEQMANRGVVLDAEFCNTLMKSLSHWKLDKRALLIYYAMMEDSRVPLPSGSTVRKAFNAAYRVAQKEPMQRNASRQVFRDMMLLQDCKPPQLRQHLDLVIWNYIHVRSLLAAFTSFLRGSDFAAAYACKDLVVELPSYYHRQMQDMYSRSMADMKYRFESEATSEGEKWSDKLFRAHTGEDYYDRNLLWEAQAAKLLQASKVSVPRGGDGTSTLQNEMPSSENRGATSLQDSGNTSSWQGATSSADNNPTPSVVNEPTRSGPAPAKSVATPSPANGSTPEPKTSWEPLSLGDSKKLSLEAEIRDVFVGQLLLRALQAELDIPVAPWDTIIDVNTERQLLEEIQKAKSEMLPSLKLSDLLEHSDTVAAIP